MMQMVGDLLSKAVVSAVFMFAGRCWRQHARERIPQPAMLVLSGT